VLSVLMSFCNAVASSLSIADDVSENACKMDRIR
jgi:hypothetical protein